MSSMLLLTQIRMLGNQKIKSEDSATPRGGGGGEPRYKGDPEGRALTGCCPNDVSKRQPMEWGSRPDRWELLSGSLKTQAAVVERAKSPATTQFNTRQASKKGVFQTFYPCGNCFVGFTCLSYCQSALKIDPPSASKIDPPQAVVFSSLPSF